MHRDQNIFPKIAEVTDLHGVDTASVIALLAINALASADLCSLSFWADLSDTTRETAVQKPARKRAVALKKAA